MLLTATQNERRLCSESSNVVVNGTKSWRKSEQGEKLYWYASQVVYRQHFHIHASVIMFDLGFAPFPVFSS